MVQDNNYKPKPLSPAVSAFQFQVKLGASSLGASPRDGTLKISTNEDYFNNSKMYQSSPNTPIVSSKEDKAYKDQVIVLDEETRMRLKQMGQLPLDADWTFWYDKFVPNLPASDYEANLKVISTAKTVQKFWSIYNNIDGPDRLGFRSNYHFMKTGIKPIWEDPKNEYGGSYNFKVIKQQSPIAWRNILVLLIGEKVEDWINNTVFGVSVSSRQYVDNYQIWTAHHNKNIQDSIVRAKLEELLYPADIQSFYFKMHKTHADFQIPTTPTSASSPKQAGDMAASLLGPIEMRRKITEESIERVVQDIEKLKLRERVK